MKIIWALMRAAEPPSKKQRDGSTDFMIYTLQPTERFLLVQLVREKKDMRSLTRDVCQEALSQALKLLVGETRAFMAHEVVTFDAASATCIVATTPEHMRLVWAGINAMELPGSTIASVLRVSPTLLGVAYASRPGFPILASQ